MADFYSLGAARRSLVHFAFGKLLSAGLGISFLLLTVRVMERSDYGRYVAVLAMIEIFYLLTGLGLSTMAQRYVAEYRVHAPASEFLAFLRRALQQRLLLSLGFALMVWLLWHPLMALTGMGLDDEWRTWVAVWLVAGAGVAFMEEIMGALLLQAYSQGLGVARNLIKLGGVALVLWLGHHVTLDVVIKLEVSLALAAWVSAELLVRRWAKHSPSSPQAKPGFSAPRMHAVSMRFYAAQMLGTAYGPNTVKLLVTRVLGVIQTAPLGFALSITDMLRNYMPAHLLAGWIRPILVARYVAQRDLGELSRIVNLVLKLNLLGLLPAAAVFAVLGDPLIAWLTAGKFHALSGILTVLVALVVVQSVHLLLSMVTLTLEQPGVSLRATIAAAFTLPAQLFLMHQMGLMGAAIGLVLAELVWVLSAWWMLRRRGFALQFDGVGTFKLVLAAGITALLAWVLTLTVPTLAWWITLLLMVPIYFIALFVVRPADTAEIAMVRRLIATRAPRMS
jgi:O-antigen/teichoic acid export membrane protein